MSSTAKQASSVYIAARTGRVHEIRARVPDIEQLGYSVIGSWVRSSPGLDPLVSTEAGAEAAESDLSEIRAAGVFVTVTEGAEASAFGRGGRHVEFGVALALEKRILVIGPVEHVFHLARGVVVCSDWSEALATLREWAREAP
jgi:hypothetical protein